MNRNIKTAIFIFFIYFFIRFLHKYFLNKKCNKITEGKNKFSFFNKKSKSDNEKKSSIIIKTSKIPCPIGHPSDCL